MSMMYNSVIYTENETLLLSIKKSNVKNVIGNYHSYEFIYYICHMITAN